MIGRIFRFSAEERKFKDTDTTNRKWSDNGGNLVSPRDGLPMDTPYIMPMLSILSCCVSAVDTFRYLQKEQEGTTANTVIYC